MRFMHNLEAFQFRCISECDDLQKVDNGEQESVFREKEGPVLLEKIVIQ